MALQALYRKYRPNDWEEVVGQDHVIRVLKNAIKSDRLSHAYLFSGPRGTGKTTVARLLARAVNCTDSDLGERPCDRCDICESIKNGRFLDIIEIDAASNTSVDDIRELRDKINFSPSLGRMKVYIIDEVHMLSTAAFNALLKTLEEPPAHAMFILATTELQKIPATVLSRCQHHEFRRFPVREIVGRLTEISNEENFTFEPEALTLIARQSTGAMRDAVTILDQISSTGEPITLKNTQTILGTAANLAVIQMIDALLDRQLKDGMDIIHKALDGGTDARQFARQTVEYLRLLMMSKLGSLEDEDVTEETRAALNQQAARLTIDKILEWIRIFNQAEVNSRLAWYPGLSLELAITEAAAETSRVTAVEPEIAVRVAEKKVAKPAMSSMEEIDDADDDDDLLDKQIRGRYQVYIRKGQTPDPSVTKAEIEKVWEEVIQLIKQHDVILAASLKPAKLMGVRNGVLILGFPRETLKNRMESKRKNMVWTSAAISSVLGKPVGVSLVIINDHNPVNMDEKPVVDAAIQLGGKLVEDKEKRKK